MRDYKAIIDAVIGFLAQDCGCAVVCGPLPPHGGLALIPSGGKETPYMDGSSLVALSVTLHTKAKELHDAINLLSRAHAALQLYNIFGSGWQLTGVSIKRPATLMAQDTAGYWIYSSTIELRAYIRPEGETNG